MVEVNQIGVTVVAPGEGDTVALPGFGAVFKLSSQNSGERWRSSSTYSRSDQSPHRTGTPARTSTRLCLPARSGFAPTTAKLSSGLVAA